MVQQNRILTVSYGTFSCTLEGFNDPFGTMKAIAEYFRDLTADDRYFGAEPPQPDAQMLHRIAEREIQRRVEAKVTENSVVLRADEKEPVAPAAEPEPEPVAPQPRIQIPAEPVVERPQPQLRASDESVAQRLAALRAATAAPAVEQETDPADLIDRDGPVVPLKMPDFSDLTLDLTPVSDESEEDTRTASELLAEADAFGVEAFEEEAFEEAEEIPVSAEEADFDFEALNQEFAEFEAEALEAAPEPELEPQPPRRVIRIQRSPAPEAAESDDAPLIASLLNSLASETQAEEVVPEPAAPEPVAEEAKPEDLISALLAGPVAEISEAGAELARPRRPERVEAATPRPAPLRPQRVRAEASTPRPSGEPGKKAVSVDRLIRQVGTEMAEPDTQRRTSTIAHLKAAVAATVAERMIPGLRREPEDETVEYRSDLATATSDDGAPRVAPLMLVSSQRVVERPLQQILPEVAPSPAPVVMPMRPRRVQSAQVAEDFNEAEETVVPLRVAPDLRAVPVMGGQEAVARLEQAAATLLAESGQESFNRPQLMRFASLEGNGFTREEALIAFGILLREGRVIRERRGVFTLPGHVAKAASEAE